MEVGYRPMYFLGYNMSSVKIIFKCLNDYVGTIAAAGTIGLFVFILDQRIMAAKYEDHVVQSTDTFNKFETFFKEQQEINNSFLQFAKSFEDIRNNGTMAARDYVDKKTKELEDRINLRIGDDKDLMRRLEREVRIAQSRLETFNNYLDQHNITIGDASR